MRILLTGVNPVSCGHRPKLDYVSSVQALKIGLEQAGHVVDLRPVELGESLVSYDWSIVMLASMRGFVAVHTLGTLWAIHASNGKCTISFDDWQVREALHGIKCFALERDKIIANNPFGYKQMAEFPRFKTQLWAVLDALVKEEWGWPVLVPAYDGGDLSLLSIPKAKVYSYNPAILFKGKYGWVTHRDIFSTKYEWVLAALHDHRSWLKKQKLAWPVTQFGHRKQGQERVAESVLHERSLGCWGRLSPAYKICGSGWWRARYGFAADALAVIAGDSRETAMIDPACYPAPGIVEKLGNGDLLELAMAQREAYYEAAGPVEKAQIAILASLQA